MSVLNYGFQKFFNYILEVSFMKTCANCGNKIRNKAALYNILWVKIY